MADNPIILAPVDFSTHSEPAVVFASNLAEHLNATLLILHVVHDPGEAPGYYAKKKGKLLKKMEDMAAEMMVEFLAKLRKKHGDLKPLKKAQTMLVVGLPVTKILQITEKKQPFMVVMGSQGRTGLAHLTLGSKAEQVAHLCPLPVTIVKADKN